MKNWTATRVTFAIMGIAALGFGSWLMYASASNDDVAYYYEGPTEVSYEEALTLVAGPLDHQFVLTSGENGIVLDYHFSTSTLRDDLATLDHTTGPQSFGNRWVPGIFGALFCTAGLLVEHGVFFTGFWR